MINKKYLNRNKHRMLIILFQTQTANLAQQNKILINVN